MSNHNIDFKGGKVIDGRDLFSPIDWSKKVDFRLSEDLITLQYENCFIDLRWYGGHPRGFSITVIVWGWPYAKIPCKDQYDMLTQLQRAIDVYPAIADVYAAKGRNQEGV